MKNNSFTILFFVLFIVSIYSKKQFRENPANNIPNTINERAREIIINIREDLRERMHEVLPLLDFLQEKARFPNYMTDLKNFTTVYWIDPTGNITSGFISLKSQNDSFLGCDRDDNLGTFESSITRNELFLPENINGDLFLRSFYTGGFIGSSNGRISCNYNREDKNKLTVREYSDENSQRKYVRLETPEGSYVSYAEAGGSVYTSDEPTQNTLFSPPFN